MAEGVPSMSRSWDTPDLVRCRVERIEESAGTSMSLMTSLVRQAEAESKDPLLAARLGRFPSSLEEGVVQGDITEGYYRGIVWEWYWWNGLSRT